MSAGGGTFTVQNKVLPGAYINFVSKAKSLGTLGVRGIVAMPLMTNWGAEGIIKLTAEDMQKNTLKILGYSYTDSHMTPLREVFRGATSVLLYRVTGGTKATATLGNLTATAKYKGTRGNDLKVAVEAIVDSNNFIISTLIDGVIVDEQIVATADEVISNDYVDFSGSGELTATAGTSLTGATDTAPTGENYSNFLSEIEKCEFTTVLYAGDDNVTKALFDSFTKRLRDDEGYKVTCVMHNYTKSDYEGVISVKNTAELVYWVAGQTAGAQINESLTNKLYDGEYSFNTAYTKTQLTESINNGEFVFCADKDGARVLKDINTLVSVTVDKNKDFTNNQVIRVLDSVANDVASIFNTYYLGKVQNNGIGRDVFKAELINYHNQLQAIQAIDNFESEDITVEQGTEKGDVVVNSYIQPIGAMEKLYMTVIVE